MTRYAADFTDVPTSDASRLAANLDDSLNQALDAMHDDEPDDSLARAEPGNARKLLDEVQQLGSRMRQSRMRMQQTDRRAAAYASRLARHTAQLLEHMPNAVPTVRPVPGTGASALSHYVLRHDMLESPSRIRLLVVSSDGRLRLCTVASTGTRSRLWSDFEVTNPPPELPLTVVFEGLSALIVQLEGAVSHAEQESAAKEATVDTLIAESELALYQAGSKLSPTDPRGTPAQPAQPVQPVETPAERDRRLRSHGFERTPVNNSE